MARHNELGKAGEEAAAALLRQKGYTILHRNWRQGHAELDIVATHAAELVVVEVKTRRSTLFGLPREAVDTGKVRRMVQAAEAYVQRYEIDLPVRFDIVCAVGHPGNLCLEHIEGAFVPPLSL